MPTFSELITKYIQRAGITDAELARKIGVRRQTIFRWKEGLVARPRHREDVTRCAKTLRLTPAEKNELLIAAGFRQDEEPGVITTVDGQGASNGSIEAAPISATQIIAQTEQITLTSSLTEKAVSPGDGTSQPLKNSEQRDLSSWYPMLLGLVVLLIFGTIWTYASLRPMTYVPQPLGTTTPAPTPIPTPILAGEGETLLLVGKFANYTSDVGYNVAGRIQEALQEEIDKAKLVDTRAIVLQEPLVQEERVKTILSDTHASMVIWGEYDSGWVQVKFTVGGDRKVADWERYLDSPDELSTTINIDVREEIRLSALIALGRLYRDEGNYDNAQMTLEHALALNPEEKNTQATIHFYLGNVKEKLADTDWDAVIDHYTEALHLRPQSLKTQYNRGTAYLRRYSERTNDPSDLDNAIADLDRIVRIEPTYTQAYINRGIAHYQRNLDGDVASAIENFTQAIELEPSAYRGYFNRGLAHIRADDSEAWQADLMAALAVEPDYASIHNALCWGYALDQAPENALEQCQRALALNPELGSTRDSIGIAYAQLGQYEDAIAAFEMYLNWLRGESEAKFSLYNGPLVEEWVDALQAGENPITEEVLETLRN